MFAQIFDANRGKLRDHPLGGYLATRGLFDKPGIETHISSRPLLTNKTYYRLIELAGYENWCRLWTSHRERA